MLDHNLNNFLVLFLDAVVVVNHITSIGFKMQIIGECKKCLKTHNNGYFLASLSNIEY